MSAGLRMDLALPFLYESLNEEVLLKSHLKRIEYILVHDDFTHFSCETYTFQDLNGEI